MKLSRLILLFIASFLSISAAYSQDEVVRWKTSVEHVEGDIYRVVFEASIDGDWHMYDLGPYKDGPLPTTFSFEPSAGLSLSGTVTMLTKPVRKYDSIYGMEIGYFEKRARFAQNVKLSSESAVLKATVEWMVCNDMNCMPPDDREFKIEIKRAPAAKSEAEKTGAESGAGTIITSGDNTQGQSADTAAGQGGNESEEGASMQTAVAQEDGTVRSIDSGAVERTSLWIMVITAMLWGLAALFTPCVFPMLPITVSFFMKGSENKVAARFRAGMFGIFIIVLYTVPIASIILATKLFGGDSAVAGIFNFLSTHWMPNIIFFLIFMLFAASFLGAFEITLPSWMVNKSDSKSEKGGLMGVFFIALTTVLVSFSCTGAIIGNVLVDAATGSTVWWEPIVVMLAFSTVFALPFMALAFAPSLLSNVKSGGWLNSVKVSLGFIEIALGFKFLMVIDQAYGLNLLPREVYLAIWIVCAFMLGFYLLGKIKFKHDSEVKYISVSRLFFVMVIFVFAVWMVPGMWGAPLKALSGYMPPLSSQSFVLGAGAGSTSESTQETGGRHTQFINPLTGKPPRFSDLGLHTPEGFNEIFFDLKEASEYAAYVNKPVFVDITGIACVNCREMEQNVWTDPTVARLLKEEFVMVAIFLDVKKDLPEDEWVVDKNGRTLKSMGKINTEWSLRTHNQVAQPIYVIQDSKGNVLVPSRSYDRSIERYIEFLESGLAAFKARQQ